MKTLPIFLLSGLLLVSSTAHLQAERITNTPQQSEKSSAEQNKSSKPQQNEDITKKEKIIEKAIENHKNGVCSKLNPKCRSN